MTNEETIKIISERHCENEVYCQNNCNECPYAVAIVALQERH